MADRESGHVIGLWSVTGKGSESLPQQVENGFGVQLRSIAEEGNQAFRSELFLFAENLRQLIGIKQDAGAIRKRKSLCCIFHAWQHAERRAGSLNHPDGPIGQDKRRWIVTGVHNFDFAALLHETHEKRSDVTA